MISKGRLVFDAVMLLLFGYLAYDSLSFTPVARHFPLYISLLAVALSILNLTVGVMKLRKQGSIVAEDVIVTATFQEDSAGGKSGDGSVALTHSETLLRALRYWAWLISFVVLMALLGIIGAIPIFLVAFLALEARKRWFFITASVVASMTLLIGFAKVMNLRWPSSLVDLEPYLSILPI